MSLFEGIFVPQELATAVADEAWLEAMLDAERALANAQALAGVLSPAAAAAVAGACDAAAFDVHELARDGQAAGNPVEPLVRRLRDRVGPEHGDAVHRGATSQDILDSAAMLVARRALRLVDAELRAVSERCAALAREHRATVIAGRTLLQQAVPTTFGLKAALWLAGVEEARRRLETVAQELPAQLGGAAGTLAGLGEGALEVLRLYAAELELREPVVPWHTVRQPVAQLAGALAAAAGACAKAAGDVVLLAQTEVAEVHERGRRQLLDDAAQAQPDERGARARLGAPGDGRGGAPARVRAPGARTGRGRVARRMGGACRRACGDRRGRGRCCAARSRRWRSTPSGCARTSPPATLSEAQRLGIDASAPEDYLGAADALVQRALERYA